MVPTAVKLKPCGHHPRIGYPLEPEPFVEAFELWRQRIDDKDLRTDVVCNEPRPYYGILQQGAAQPLSPIVGVDGQHT